MNIFTTFVLIMILIHAHFFQNFKYMNYPTKSRIEKYKKLSLHFNQGNQIWCY